MLMMHYIASSVKSLEYELDILNFLGLHYITSDVKSLEYATFYVSYSKTALEGVISLCQLQLSEI